MGKDLSYLRQATFSLSQRQRLVSLSLKKKFPSNKMGSWVVRISFSLTMYRNYSPKKANQIIKFGKINPSKEDSNSMVYQKKKKKKKPRIWHS